MDEQKEDELDAAAYEAAHARWVEGGCKTVPLEEVRPHFDHELEKALASVPDRGIFVFKDHPHHFWEELTRKLDRPDIYLMYVRSVERGFLRGSTRPVVLQPIDRWQEPWSDQVKHEIAIRQGRFS